MSHSSSRFGSAASSSRFDSASSSSDEESEVSEVFDASKYSESEIILATHTGVHPDNLKTVESIDLCMLPRFCDFSMFKQLISVVLINSPFVPFNPMPNLRELTIMDTTLNDVTCIGGCINLRKLVICGNGVRDLRPLKRLKQLEYLDVCDNEIDSIDGLGSLSSLTFLNVANNNISDVMPITTCVSLRELNLSGNNINTFSHLSRLSVLPLQSLILQHPMWGHNGVCKLANYQIFCQLYLNQLKFLDTKPIQENFQSNQMFQKKLLYYSMKIVYFNVKQLNLESVKKKLFNYFDNLFNSIYNRYLFNFHSIFFKLLPFLNFEANDKEFELLLVKFLNNEKCLDFFHFISNNLSVSNLLVGFDQDDVDETKNLAHKMVDLCTLYDAQTLLNRKIDVFAHMIINELKRRVLLELHSGGNLKFSVDDRHVVAALVDNVDFGHLVTQGILGIRALFQEHIYNKFLKNSYQLFYDENDTVSNVRTMFLNTVDTEIVFSIAEGSFNLPEITVVESITELLFNIEPTQHIIPVLVCRVAVTDLELGAKTLTIEANSQRILPEYIVYIDVIRQIKRSMDSGFMKILSETTLFKELPQFLLVKPFLEEHAFKLNTMLKGVSFSSKRENRNTYLPIQNDTSVRVMDLSCLDADVLARPINLLNFSSLNYLFLKFNYLKETPSFLNTLAPSLVGLDLSNNSLTECNLKNVQLPKLKFLNVSNNQIGALESIKVSHPTVLKFLNIVNNPVLSRLKDHLVLNIVTMHFANLKLFNNIIINGNQSEQNKLIANINETNDKNLPKPHYIHQISMLEYQQNLNFTNFENFDVYVKNVHLPLVSSVKATTENGFMSMRSRSIFQLSITKSVDPSIMSHVRLLDLSHNILTSLHIDIDQMPNLANIDLSYNNLNTLSFSRNSNEVLFLNVSHNSFRDCNFLESLPSLKLLDMTANDMRVFKPPIMLCLQELYLAFNMLSNFKWLESICDTESNSKLIILDVSNNPFLNLANEKKVYDWIIWRLPHLRVLNGSSLSQDDHNRVVSRYDGFLSHSLLRTRSNVPFNETSSLNLSNLNLSDCTTLYKWNADPSELIVGSGSKFPKLQVLNLNRNVLDNLDFLKENSFNSLVELSVSHNVLTSDTLGRIDENGEKRGLFAVPRLDCLRITTNRLSSLDNLDLAFYLPHLRTLNLAHNRVNKLKFISGFKKLRELSLDQNSIRDIPRDTFENVPLRELRISGNPIQSLSFLQNCSVLRVFIAKDTNIESFEELHHMRYCPLKKGQFMGSPVSRRSLYEAVVLSNAPNLRILDDHEITAEDHTNAQEAISLVSLAPVRVSSLSLDIGIHRRY
ncbi:hypothetical protein PCE1_002572 [Barthelona sp. PCE]